MDLKSKLLLINNVPFLKLNYFFIINYKYIYFYIPDDLEPLTDDLDFDSQVRHSSSIHIRIFRTAMIGANQSQ